MGRKKKNNGSEKRLVSVAEERRKNEENLKRTKLFVRIFAIVALVAVVLTVFAVLGVNIYNGLTINYFEDDLSRYIYISRDDYSHFEGEVDIDEVDDRAVEHEILKMLFRYRTLDGKGGYNTTTQTVDGVKRFLSAGDDVKIRYIEYYFDENGVRINASAKLDSYEICKIGQGVYPTGVELGLLGVDIDKVPPLVSTIDRPVALGDTVKLTYSAFYADGKVAEEITEYVTVDPDVCDALYGEGFADYLIGKNVGTFDEMFSDEKDQIFKATTEDGKTNSYFDFKLHNIYEKGSPLTVEAVYSVDYDGASLAGRTVYYDIYIEGYQMYTVPTLDDGFIGEKLKLTMDDLKEYSGDSLTDRYRSYIKKTLENTAMESANEKISGIMWEHYLDKVEVRWLPEGSVMEYYNGFLDSFEADFASNSQVYGNFDSYMLTKLGLSEGDDWRAVIRERAEQSVVEEAIFYYIVRAEGYLPSAEKEAELIKEIRAEELEYIIETLGVKREDFDTEEKYAERIKECEKMLDEVYDESYFKERAIHSYAYEKLYEFGKITYK